jgi:hypothetical protein
MVRPWSAHKDFDVLVLSSTGEPAEFVTRCTDEILRISPLTGGLAIMIFLTPWSASGMRKNMNVSLADGVFNEVGCFPEPQLVFNVGAVLVYCARADGEKPGDLR